MKAKHSLRWSGFLVMILGLALLLPSGVSAQEDLQDPWEITEDTTLTEDHDARIRIATDDVTFDCAGHTLTFRNRPDFKPACDSGSAKLPRRGPSPVARVQPRPARTG